MKDIYKTNRQTEAKRKRRDWTGLWEYVWMCLASLTYQNFLPLKDVLLWKLSSWASSSIYCVTGQIWFSCLGQAPLCLSWPRCLGDLHSRGFQNHHLDLVLQLHYLQFHLVFVSKWGIKKEGTMITLHNCTKIMYSWKEHFQKNRGKLLTDFSVEALGFNIL